MWIALLLLACTSPPPSSTAPSSSGVSPATGTPPATPPASPGAAAAPLAAAPSLDIYGLVLGQSGDADIQAWLAERKLTCPGAPSPRRTTYRYDCNAGLSASLLPDRTISGTLANLLIVRGDATPMTHFSTQRRYSLPADAIADYMSTLAALTARYGPPAGPVVTPDPARMDGPMVHYTAAWAFTDLDLRVSLLRAGSPYLGVSEAWDVPGSEKNETARPTPTGANPHGPPPGTPGGPPGGAPSAPSTGATAPSANP